MKYLKTLRILFVAFVFAVTSCNAQSIKGNKNVISQERQVSPFTQLSISGVSDVWILQGDKESVKITTDENIQPYIETVNEGNKLSVRTKKHENINSSELKIEITVKDINELSISGTGNIKTSSTLNLENMSFTSSGTGDISMDFSCNKLFLKITGAGNVSLKGKADDAQILMSGAGNLKAFDFAAKKLTAKMSGMGNAELNAETELSIDASGMGNITYKGTASVKKLDASATGTVRKM